MGKVENLPMSRGGKSGKLANKSSGNWSIKHHINVSYSGKCDNHAGVSEANNSLLIIQMG